MNRSTSNNGYLLPVAPGTTVASIMMLSNVLVIVLLISNFPYVLNPFLNHNMLSPPQAAPRTVYDGRPRNV